MATATADATTHEVTDLLQHLIRNACVNDGSAESGQEVRSADLLASYLEGPGLALERYEAAPGRTSLVARIEGTDPDAPTLLLMGHTDVVPANPEGWRHDPFGGELIDGEVWGRGAVDMLNLTASMAVATKHLARGGFRPKGTLVYLAVADEEALGSLGAGHLVDHEADAVRADYVITESGGIPIPSPTGLKLPVIVAEKGSCWVKLRVRGTPGHGSPAVQDRQRPRHGRPRRAAPRRVRARAPQIHDTWRRFLEGMDYPEEMVQPLLDPDTFLDACEVFPVGMARQFHACTHTTFAPTMAQAGTKINVIPDLVDLQVDIRTLPGHGEAEVRAMLDEALGDLADKVEVAAAARRPVDRVARRHAALGLDRPGDAAVLRGLEGRAVHDRRRHRRPLLPATRHHGLRLRPVLHGHVLRGLRLDVPRRRRAHRRRLARACPPSCGTPCPATCWRAERHGASGRCSGTSAAWSSPAPSRRSTATRRRTACPRDLIRTRQRHEPRHQRVGEARAQRGRLRRVLRPVRGRVPRARPSGRGPRDARAAARRDPPGGGRGDPPLPRRRARHGVPDEQLRHRRPHARGRPARATPRCSSCSRSCWSRARRASASPTPRSTRWRARWPTSTRPRSCSSTTSASTSSRPRPWA